MTVNTIIPDAAELPIERVREALQDRPLPPNFQHPNKITQSLESRQHTQWAPWGSPGRLSDKCKSETANEARRLWDAIGEAQKEKAKLLAESDAAFERVRNAQRALDGLTTRTFDSKAREAAIQELEAAKARGSESEWRENHPNGNPAVTVDVATLDGYLTSHPELATELKADAGRVHRE